MILFRECECTSDKSSSRLIKFMIHKSKGNMFSRKLQPDQSVNQSQQVNQPTNRSMTLID